MKQYPTGDRRLYLVERLAAIQRAQRDFTGAQLTLETHWPVALRAREGHWSHELLEEYRHLLRAQKRPQEVVDVTRELIEARPEEALHRWTRVAARTQGDWYGKGDVNRMVDALLEVGNRAEALRWAKLGWQMSAFSKQGVAEASAALAKGWSGPGLDLSHVRAFALAQRDADAPNPLREVELPTWDKTVLRRTIKNMGDESAKVTLLIADQRLGEALAVAQRMIESDPLGVRGAAGVRGVAQVFKAHDLNTVRANAFVQWIAKPNGEVENPLPALERELAAEAKPAN